MSRLFITLQYLLPQHAISRLTGWLASCRLPWIKNPLIAAFKRRYQVDLSEARIDDYREFDSFNAFFTRELDDSARPLDGGPASLVSPADGTVSDSGMLNDELVLQAKGIDYRATELLGGDPAAAEPFKDGSFVTIYLAPRDYHRVHMPLAGTLLETVYVPGRLFSVNAATTARVPGLFTRNERLVCRFDTPAGPMALILVGAMIVAGIETVWAGQACPNNHGLLHTDYREHSPPLQLARGSEMGRFMLGSTVILLFGPGAVAFDPDLAPGSGVRMGAAIGRIKANSGAI